MKLLKCLILLLAFSTLQGQNSNITSFSLKKGEIFDLVLLNQKPDTKAALQDYFKNVVSVGKSYGYEGIYTNTVANYTLGNFQPQLIIFGKWPNLKNRLEFIDVIETSVPDFHERRRHIFSAFFLTFWELKQDLNFKINKDKFTIVTAFWKKDSKFGSFKNQWNQLITKNAGTELISFTDGQSPFGYEYNPDYLVISEFKDEAAFKAFQNATKNLNYEGVRHVQQLVVQ